MGSIKVSPKHGVNPSISVCFWCGEHKNELILLGRLPDDKEAPREAVFNLEPCEACQERMGLGITIIEAHRHGKQSEPQIQPGVWVTGRWLVLKEDALERIFDEEMAKACAKHRMAYIEPEAFAMLAGPETQS